MNNADKRLKLKKICLSTILALCGMAVYAQNVTEVYIEKEKNTYTINTAGTYKIIGTRSTTSNNIVVNVDGVVDLTIENVNISTNGSNGAAFDITQGTVNLTLSGKNTLISTDGRKAGLRVAEKTSLTITEASNGSSLQAQGHQFYGGAGIGSNQYETAGAIIINGGTIRAEHGDCAAGIGGGNFGNASSITINGGNVTALTHSSSGDPASIGGGGFGDGGTIAINGGTVIALIDNSSIGSIGHGATKNTTSVTITGGSVYYDATIQTVTPTDRKSNKLVKKEISNLPANAQIRGLSGANEYSITDMYADKDGKIYLWLPKNSSPSVDKFIAPQKVIANKDGSPWSDHNKVFTVKKDNTGGDISGTEDAFYLEDGSYTIYADGTTTNQTIVVSGASTQSATVDYYTVTYDLNGGTGTVPSPGTYLKGDNITVDIGTSYTRSGYTFKGWGAISDAIEKVETISNIKKATMLYAIWEAVPFTTKSIADQELTYKTAYTFNVSDLSDDIAKAGGLKEISIKSGDLPVGISFNNSAISGTPTAANEDGVDVTFTLTANNDTKQDVTIKFKVKKKELTVVAGEVITKEYDGNTTVTTPDALKLEGIIEGDDVSLADYTLTYDDATVGEDKEITISALSLEGITKDNYSLPEPITLSLKGTITPKELTIIPKSNQQLFPDEVPDYDVSGAVEDDEPTFEGALKVDGGYIINNDLKLTGEFEKNYTLSITTGISVTILNNEIVKTMIKLSNNTNADGSYKDQVTFTAPDGFKIALVEGTLKSTLSYDKSFIWNTLGTYIITYQLKRDTDGQESPQYEKEVTVVATPVDPPTPPVDPEEPVDPPVSVFYTVTLPAVEGATTDPESGSHKIESMSSFSFSLTLAEGYREQSQPVVKANGEVIAPDNKGKYIIKYIRNDISIAIEGIRKDTPTDNAVIDDNILIRVIDGTIQITVPHPADATIADMSGRLMRTLRLAPGDTKVEGLHSGMYIVKIEGEKGRIVIIKK